MDTKLVTLRCLWRWCLCLPGNVDLGINRPCNRSVHLSVHPSDPAIWILVFMYVCPSWATFLSLAWSELRLCSANHRPGYWSNLPWNWLSKRQKMGPVDCSESACPSIFTVCWFLCGPVLPHTQSIFFNLVNINHLKHAMAWYQRLGTDNLPISQSVC